VKSARTTAGAGGGAVRIVGEVLNNTGTTRGQVTVRATFRDGSGGIVGLLATTAFARRLADGEVTPFVLAGAVPAYTSVSWSMTSGGVPLARSLQLVSITATPTGTGTVTETGVVRNTGVSTLTSVAVARTWYGRLGEVLDRGVASTSPSTLAPGRTASFTILRPVLASAQYARTQLRGS
jgi:hypothetical protein